MTSKLAGHKDLGIVTLRALVILVFATLDKDKKILKERKKVKSLVFARSVIVMKGTNL